MEENWGLGENIGTSATQTLGSGFADFSFKDKTSISDPTTQLQLCGETLHKASLFFSGGRTFLEFTSHCTVGQPAVCSGGHQVLRALTVVRQVKFSKLFLGNSEPPNRYTEPQPELLILSRSCIGLWLCHSPERDFKQVTPYTRIFSKMGMSITTLHNCAENR